MPILYHFTLQDVNDKNGKYSARIFNFSVQNAQVFSSEELSPNFYESIAYFVALFVCLCIICVCVPGFIHNGKTSLRIDRIIYKQ